jgi:DNA-binding GntR family transcriptional regulator
VPVVHTPLYTAPADGATATATAYHALKRSLLAGQFRLGARLGEVALAERFGVSRTPIREALTRLYAEGFVVRLPEGGYSPAAPDLHTIAELYVVRRALELAALHEPRHDLAALEALRAHWAGFETPSGADPDFVLLDEEFHLRLAESSGNRSLAQLLATVNERIRIVRIHDFLTVGRIKATIAEHLSIVDALLENDTPLAEDRLTRHLSVSRKVVERRASKALSQMVHGSRDV